MTWSPTSWRIRPALQMPEYGDRLALQDVESCLASAAPVAEIPDCRRLGEQVAEAAANGDFILQGGDCAESFEEFSPEKVRGIHDLLGRMALPLGGCSERRVIQIARIAGQFAKPRSSPIESSPIGPLPVYRGDMINGADPSSAARTADPRRMLEAHRQALVTTDLLRSLAAACRARGANPYSSESCANLLAPYRSASPGDDGEVFTSHEALLLPYEQALVRWDSRSECWWSTSAHMLWLGQRTQQIDGAHVEFARGIANTLGLKCGPDLQPDQLLRLIAKLDPENRPGRLILIARFGVDRAQAQFEALLRATRREGCAAIWISDPMHGNTIVSNGRKTRRLSDIMVEIETFLECASAEGVAPGGLHLEMTGDLVTECLGGTRSVKDGDLDQAYRTLCDPRLNRSQALEIAERVGRCLSARHPLTRGVY